MRIRWRIQQLSRRTVLLGSTGLLIVVVGWFLLSGGSGGADSNPGGARPARTVTVVEASAASHSVEIVGLAEVRPRWTSTLRARVGGALREVSKKLQPGVPVASGELLAALDGTAWLANLAEAENRLALAELELLRERQEAEEARESWRESELGGEPASALVLRAPQVEAAQVQVEAARRARDWASQQLQYTEIHAPFSGIVTARHVSLGESILEGEAVAEVFATDVFEVALQVSERQWRALVSPVVGTVAVLVDPEGSGRWRAEVARVGGSIDPTTRMRTLYLAISDPLGGELPLLPGAFVEVRLSGREVDRLLELPEGTLTRGGHVWYVDADDTLRRFSAEPLFTRRGHIYVHEPSPAARWRIVRYPLDSFMAGQSVRAQVAGTEEG